MQLIDLELKNFQRHKRYRLQFSPTITTVIGSTDTGKSSILRALRWLCLNDFSGDDFIHEGEKQASVKLQIDVGQKKKKLVTQVIERIKGKSGSGVNDYALDGKEFKSFATNVPDNISDVLRLNDINFQGQHDSPFWFHETAGEVSRKLNAIVDLSIIDSALAEVQRQVREADTRVDIWKEEEEKARDEWKLLELQAQRVQDFQKLKALYEQLEQSKKDLHLFSELRIKARGNKSRQKEEELRLEAMEPLLQIGQALQFETEQTLALSQLVLKASAVNDRTQEPPPFDSLLLSFEEWKQQEVFLHGLEQIYTKVTSVEMRLLILEKEAKQAEMLFHKEFNNKECPLCKKPLALK